MGYELSARQKELAADFAGRLAEAPGAVASALPDWAGLTVPAEHGGRGLGQAEALVVAEETGRANRDGSLLDLAGAAEALVAGPGTGLAADALRGLLTATQVPAVGWHLHPDGSPDRASHDSGDGLALRLPHSRDFVSGLPARIAVLRLHRGGGACESFAVLPLRGSSWTAQRGVLAEERARLELRGAVAAQEAMLFETDGAGPALDDLAGIRRAGYLWGLADAAVTEALHRVRTRRQFDRPIGSHQAVAFPLAALTARLRAARLLTHYAAWLADGGLPLRDEPDKRPLADRVADLLRHNADLARDAAWCALHLHGAYGLTEESAAQLLYRRVLFHTALAQPAAGSTAHSRSTEGDHR